jgi:hypothetical protein
LNFPAAQLRLKANGRTLPSAVAKGYGETSSDGKGLSPFYKADSVQCTGEENLTAD